ncbi:MAG: HEAT repeat domain-containing protein [Prevotellaceae bacterium]|jgi:HEAT repeat protein|nr:HEAT repeat domain-containing protein [Prevotellaceae bacterium]
MKNSDIEKKFLELLKKQMKTKNEILELENTRLKLERILNDDEKPLIEDLLKAGINVKSVWDLVNTKESYPNAILILIEHLKKDYHEKNKEGIVRALAVKEAIGAANSVLIAEYNRIPKNKMSLRWAIGNTIYAIMTEKDVDPILSIVHDKTNGMSRDMFVAALGKVKSKKAEGSLISLLDDEEVTLPALGALCRMKSKKAENKISMLIKHPNVLIRKEAQKAFKKISQQ